ncbi:MAG TPA: ABC transporter ATP-binding protein [Trebonia sp.]|jgi:branched-chain amino acid transport system ATP-binding protein|nr:ABC transporter ATP-binding protein [Trebonia sp.]
MLQVHNVTAGYGDTVVLRDVTMEVRPGQVVALLGPNGAGKTTLLRVAAGQLPVRAGRLKLGADDVTGRSPHWLARKGLCLIAEGRAIFPNLTVRENLVLQSPAGREAASIDRAFGAFPFLSKKLKQTAGSLSGGEQQMLAMVRSYVADPAIVLVDEASMGLAPVIVDRLFGFLGEIATAGTSLLIVEQYVSRALEIADYVYLLSRGTIAAQGDAAAMRGEDIFGKYLGIDVAS